MDVTVELCDNISETASNTAQLATKVPLGFALSFILLMIVGGNVLVLLSVAVNDSLRTVTNYFVLNLAIADVLLGILVLPFSAALQLEGLWMFGQTFCDIWASTDVLCSTASILSLCAISIDRYIGVTRPLQHRVSAFILFLLCLN